MNPLLDTSALPRFADIRPEHALPAIEELISAHRQKLRELIDNNPTPTFDELVPSLEGMSHELGRVWSPIGHLHNVMGDDDWREAYNDCLAAVTAHLSELSQNAVLQRAFESLSEQLGENASAERRQVIEHNLREFRLAGVALPDDEKAEFRQLRQELAKVQSQFEQNVRDSTDAWFLRLDDEHQLAGLPTAIRERARAEAEAAEESGYRLTLDFPTYQAVMTHADDVELRQRFYRAWATRASDEADNPDWNNAAIIDEIMAMRHKLANMVDYDSFADYSLATKMAASVAEVVEFLTELADRTRDAAKAELADLAELAGREIDPWDVNYYLEKLKETRYAVSDEIIRQYLPVSRVADGMFRLAEKLYQVRVTPVDDVSAWHDTVRYYELHDQDGSLIGGFYTDLFARPGKRSGAWVDECVVRMDFNDNPVLPVGYLVCNFSPPDSNGVSLLSHNDMVTLFHEFGHMLHHLLTRVNYPSIAGINGVPWDAVELPSQFMENFAWSYEVLSEASAHSDTGEPLPREIFDKLNASRFCGAAIAMIRQLEFALYDFRLHAEYRPELGARALDFLKEIQQTVSVIRHADFNRFPMSFSHIFAGGYAAGYYSYKWAEVLAADAFSAFEESGLFDVTTAARFRSEILEVGGSRDIMDAFVAFRGRRPTLDALLRQSGIGLAA